MPDADLISLNNSPGGIERKTNSKSIKIRMVSENYPFLF